MTQLDMIRHRVTLFNESTIYDKFSSKKKQQHL